MRQWLAAAAALMSFAFAEPALSQAAHTPDPPSAEARAKSPPRPRPVTLPARLSQWSGDFDAMLERRLVRVVVPFSRSLYYSEQGRERGLSAQLIRDFERYLNSKYAKRLGRRPLTVTISPMTRDRLLSEVNSGFADLAVGNLTRIDERLKLVDMFVPQRGVPPIREILVTGPAAPAIATLDALSGKTVHVRRSSAYYDSLAALNDRFGRDAKTPLQIVLVPDALEDEDMMEMLNAGLFQAIVVDDWKAKLWQPALPKLVVRENIVLRDDVSPGWAFRKDSPALAAEIADFEQNWASKHGVIAYRLKRELKRVKQISDPTRAEARQRFEQMLAIFEKYGAQYNFDPLLLMAQGYQESQLDQRRRSHVGAIGIMQIMPATGAEMKVGDITLEEPNIHAGARYLNTLMTRYFAQAKFSEIDRTLFAFASYNCGPGNVAKARREAERRGLDPNVWFNNVEIVIADRIGLETTTYVRNVYKYYVAYKLIEDARRQTDAVRRSLMPTAN